jgi:hypothetical protein
MTPLLDRAVRSHRQFIRRTHGSQPSAFLVHPEDDRKLGAEFRWFRPQTQAEMPEPMEPTFKRIKGIAVYADPRVPRGCIALLK